MGILTREDYKKILDDMNTSPITRTILDFAERVEEEVRKKLTQEDYNGAAKQQIAELQASLAATKEQVAFWQQEYQLEQQKHNKEIAKAAEDYAKLEAKGAYMQSRIDELMLGYCPNEMTEEQMEQYAKCQAVSNRTIGKIK